MERTVDELEFISQINRDGMGVEILDQSFVKRFNFKAWIENRKLRLIRLSITEKTYIAFGMNSYVVKIKDE